MDKVFPVRFQGQPAIFIEELRRGEYVIRRKLIVGTDDLDVLPKLRSPQYELLVSAGIGLSREVDRLLDGRRPYDIGGVKPGKGVHPLWESQWVIRAASDGNTGEDVISYPSLRYAVHKIFLTVVALHALENDPEVAQVRGTIVSNPNQFYHDIAVGFLVAFQRSSKLPLQLLAAGGAESADLFQRVPNGELHIEVKAPQYLNGSISAELLDESSLEKMIARELDDANGQLVGSGGNVLALAAYWWSQTQIQCISTAIQQVLSSQSRTDLVGVELIHFKSEFDLTDEGTMPLADTLAERHFIPNVAYTGSLRPDPTKASPFQESVRPKLRLVEDVLRRFNFPEESPPRDALISTSCPGCGHPQTLGQARLQLLDEETVYLCCNLIASPKGTKACSRAIAFVSPFVPGSRVKRGMRIGDAVIRNQNDMLVPIGIQRKALIPGALGASSRGPRRK